MNERALSPGITVHNRYRIERVLGVGGFGVTYQVTDLREGRIAAMKEYMPNDVAYRISGTLEVQAKQNCLHAYEKFRNQFLEEAQIIYRYRGHPNIIEVYHLFRENNTAYYVMEFINGMDMGKYTNHHGGRLSWDVLQPIISQVVQALKLVHRSNMIHCDISPDNIFILDSGQVKLIDFGAAKSVLHGDSSMVLMKRGFAPPEQISGRGQLGPWTDIYALAVTIYWAFTGRMPPSSADRLASDHTIWPSQMGIAAPFPHWEQVLKRAMALRVEDRYQRVADFWAELSGTTEPYGASAAFQPVSYQNTALGLECLQGTYAGSQLLIQQEVVMGTDPSRCNVVFPPGTPGVSRAHLRIWPQDGGLMVMDLRSTYGTWINNQRMSPGLAYPMSVGSSIYFGSGQIFRCFTNRFEGSVGYSM